MKHGFAEQSEKYNKREAGPDGFPIKQLRYHCREMDESKYPPAITYYLLYWY